MSNKNFHFMKKIEQHELYQRVEHVAKTLAGSVPQLAKALGREYRTFKGYLSEKRQDNLWPLLPEILDIYPRLSRQWLYFGEGPMLIGHGVPLDKPVPLRMIAEAVDAMAKDAGGTTGELLRYVAGLPLNDVKESGISAEAEVRIRALEQKLAEKHEELDMANKKIIGLQDELLALHRRQAETLVFSSGAGPSPAPTGHTAARSSRPDNE